MKKGDIFKYNFFVSPTIYEGFMKLFNDRNILHTSDEYARTKKFKEKIIHGNILNGFISYFIGECLPLKNVIIQAQEIKYYNPLYLNDKLLFTAEIYDIFESVNLVEIKFLFTKEDSIRVAKGLIKIGLI